jgi:predicted DNA-binding antitoxin AbrB/MazE fold protein
MEKPMKNLTPFPTREGGKFKVSLLLRERFRERFSRYRKKLENKARRFLLIESDENINYTVVISIDAQNFLSLLLLL